VLAAFAQTLLAMKRVRPDILPEFKERLSLLQKEHPLTEPALSVIQRLFIRWVYCALIAYSSGQHACEALQPASMSDL